MKYFHTLESCIHEHAICHTLRMLRPKECKLQSRILGSASDGGVTGVGARVSVRSLVISMPSCLERARIFSFPSFPKTSSQRHPLSQYASKISDTCSSTFQFGSSVQTRGMRNAIIMVNSYLRFCFYRILTIYNLCGRYISEHTIIHTVYRSERSDLMGSTLPSKIPNTYPG